MQTFMLSRQAAAGGLNDVMSNDFTAALCVKLQPVSLFTSLQSDTIYVCFSLFSTGGLFSKLLRITERVQYNTMIRAVDAIYWLHVRITQSGDIVT